MVAPKSASTVIFLREDRTDGFNVLMLKRNVALEFVGGAHVFPGGKLEENDKNPELYRRCRGIDDAEASSLLDIGKDGLSYYIAAVRESFEEAGVFLGAVRGGRQALDFAALSQARKQLNEGQVSFWEIVRELDLEIFCDDLIYFAHWITPEGSPRRFNTRFFISSFPCDQVVDADYGESTSLVWISPKQAVERHSRGEFEMILPTVKNLELLSEFSSVKEVLDWASQRRDIPAITPKLVDLNGKVEVLLPDHPLYESSVELFLQDARDLPT